MSHFFPGVKEAGGGSGRASDIAATVGEATSRTLSAKSASLSRVMEASAEASTFAPNLWRISLRRNAFLSGVPLAVAV